MGLALLNKACAFARWRAEPPIRCYAQNEGLTSAEADWVIERSTPFGGLGGVLPDIEFAPFEAVRLSNSL
jgi:hypothetical protein